MSLIRTSLLNGIAVVVKVGVAIVLNKILAVLVGPAGYAAIGQFQNALGIAVSIAGGVLGPGVTKGTAEHFECEDRQHGVWRTAVRLTLVSTVMASVVIFFGRAWLAEHLLQRPDMLGVFVGLALALPAIAANNLLLAILNGKKEVRIFVAANIIGSLVSLLLVGILTSTLGLYGALLGLTISPAAILIATIMMSWSRKWLRAAFLFGPPDGPSLRELSGFGLMGITAALTSPLAYIAIRDLLAAELGLQAAGFWQASFKISEIYLMMVTLTMSAYYLPRLAEIRFVDEMKVEIRKVYLFVLPLVVIGSVIMYLWRDFIVVTLFSIEFSPMRELFGWQLTGDVLKVGAWILSYIMLARAMVRTFICTEILFAGLFYVLAHLFVKIYGLQGVSMAYAATYAAYWISMAYLVRIEMQRMSVNKLARAGA